MKTLKGLTKRVTPVEEDGAVPAEVIAMLPTIKRIVLINVGGGNAKDGDEATKIPMIAQKIRSGFKVGTIENLDEVDLEDAEFEIVKERCKTAAGYRNGSLPGLWHGEVMLVIKDAEKE